MVKTIEVSGSEPLVMAKYEAFAQAYVKNGQKGKEAAISAGYAGKHASREGVRLKENREIANRIAFLSGMELRKHDLTIDNFVQAVREHIDFDLTMLYDKNKVLINVPDLKPEVARCIVGVDVSRGEIAYEDESCQHCGGVLKTEIVSSVLKYRIEGKSRYTEQLGKYLQVIKDQVGIETYNELRDKADRRGEDIYRQSLDNKKRDKEYDHPDIEAEA